MIFINPGIKQMCPDANPDYLLVDFERGSFNVFKEVWPMTDVKGCFFHLSQSVYRKVKELGLTTNYTHSIEMTLTIRMLPVLLIYVQKLFFLHFKYSNPNLRLKWSPYINTFKQLMLTILISLGCILHHYFRYQCGTIFI